MAKSFNAIALAFLPTCRLHSQPLGRITMAARALGKRFFCVLLAAGMMSLGALDAAAGQTGTASPSGRNGARDFDFALGEWRTEIIRHPDPFGAGAPSVRLTGTVTVRPVWGGKGLIEEIETSGPDGAWQALTLFLYNPQSRQWAQYFANSKEGRFSSAPLVGAFAAGKGELYSQDTFQGKTILVRGVWSAIEPDSHAYQESYSLDGGRTWKLAFDARLTRLPDRTRR